jgi:hypothetical protein
VEAAAPLIRSSSEFRLIFLHDSIFDVTSRARMLDKLIGSVSLLFVLSLSTERIAELFKRRNWTGRLLWPPNWFASGNWVSVDLRTGTVMEKQGKRDVGPVVDPERKRRHLKAANASTTFLVGILVAGLTGADAVGPLLQDAWWKSLDVGAVKVAVTVFGIVATGAASGIGSSFWHDLLGMLIEVKRLRSSLADASSGEPEEAPLAGPGGARKEESAKRIALYQAVADKAAELRARLGHAVVVRQEQEPGFAIEVRRAAGSDSVELTPGNGETLKVPVRVRPA